MILTLLLSLPLSAQAQTPVQDPVAQPDPQQWWTELSPEEQQEMRRRLEKMQKMPEEQRAEMQRRKKVFEQEKDLILKGMGAEERAQYDALSEREQRRLLRRRVHENLRARGEDLKERHPNMKGGRQGFEILRQKQVREGLEKAAADGWIGKRAVDWLAEAPLHEQMQVLMEVRKWEVLERAALGGLWEELGLEEQEQIRISSLPAPEFFHELRAMTGEGPSRRGGRMGDPGGIRPPHHGRGPGTNGRGKGGHGPGGRSGRPGPGPGGPGGPDPNGAGPSDPGLERPGKGPGPKELPKQHKSLRR